MRAHARTASRAGPSRWASSGDGAASRVETSSARMRRDPPHALDSRARSRCTTETLAPYGAGWTKCTPSSTESRISRCEWPTTTTSGRAGRLASAAGDVLVADAGWCRTRRGRPSPEWTSATTTSASRRIAANDRRPAPAPIRATRTRPPSWSRSQTIVPGVVKPVTATRTPCALDDPVRRVQQGVAG